MYKDFLYFKFDNYIPSHICDEIIKNHTQFIDGTIEGKRLDKRTPMVEQSYRKSQIQWITTPFYTNLIFQIFQQSKIIRLSECVRRKIFILVISS